MASAEIKALEGWRFRVLLASVALSGLGYLAVSLWGGWHEVLRALSAIGLGGAVIVLGLSLVNYCLRFVRWQYYLQLLGHPIPPAPSLRIYLSGFALTTTPGKAGEMLRSVFLKYHGVPYSKSLAAFFAERLCDFIAVFILVAAGAWRYENAQLPIFGLGAVLVLGLILLRNPHWLQKIEIYVERLPRPRLQAFLVSVIETALNFRRCFSFSIIVYAIFLGLFAWSAEGLGLYYVANWMGGGVSFLEAVFIYAFSVLVGALSFLPGGLGGTEATMIGLLLLNGMNEAQAVACTLFIRVATLWFAVILGLLALPRKG